MSTLSPKREFWSRLNKTSYSFSNNDVNEMLLSSCWTWNGAIINPTGANLFPYCCCKNAKLNCIFLDGINSYLEILVTASEIRATCFLAFSPMFSLFASACLFKIKSGHFKVTLTRKNFRDLFLAFDKRISRFVVQICKIATGLGRVATGLK
jgi:hypothetical protein